jgi:hypothetical protein
MVGPFLFFVTLSETKVFCHPERIQSFCHLEQIQRFCHLEQIQIIVGQNESKVFVVPSEAKVFCRPERSRRAIKNFGRCELHLPSLLINTTKNEILD